MKTYSLIITLILIAVNVLMGCIIRSYDWQNVLISSTVIACNWGLILAALLCRLKDAFRVALCSLFPVLAAAQFVLAVLMPRSLADNWYAVAIICLLFLQVIILLTVNVTSNKTD